MDIQKTVNKNLQFDKNPRKITGTQIERLESDLRKFGDLSGVEKNKETKSINEIQEEIIEEFSAFDDWMDKYSLLIEMGNKLSPLDVQYKTANNLIEGCQSRVWLQADYEDGKVIFRGDSHAVIVKGIVSLLIYILSGHTPDEILDADLYFIEAIGLQNNLSPNRSNGLGSMLKQMKMYAKILNNYGSA